MLRNFRENSEFHHFGSGAGVGQESALISMCQRLWEAQLQDRHLMERAPGRSFAIDLESLLQYSYL
jgi:hypothetical protein